VIGPVLTTVAVVVADGEGVVAGVVLLPPPPPSLQPESIALRVRARSIRNICGLQYVSAANIVLILLFFSIIYFSIIGNGTLHGDRMANLMPTVIVWLDAENRRDSGVGAGSRRTSQAMYEVISRFEGLCPTRRKRIRGMQ
jgi:hypothetical protein